MIPGSQKSRQNRDEYHKMKLEASKVLHPNVAHLGQVWAEEKVLSFFLYLNFQIEGSYLASFETPKALGYSLPESFWPWHPICQIPPG